MRGHKKTKRWQKIEAAVCEAEGLPHLGGPGRPDCPGIEVKDRRDPIGRSTVEHDIGRYQDRGDALHKYYSTSGFRPGALDALRDAGVQPVEISMPKRRRR